MRSNNETQEALLEHIINASILAGQHVNMLGT